MRWYRAILYPAKHKQHGGRVMAARCLFWGCTGRVYCVYAHCRNTVGAIFGRNETVVVVRGRGGRKGKQGHRQRAGITTSWGLGAGWGRPLVCWNVRPTECHPVVFCSLRREHTVYYFCYWLDTERKRLIRLFVIVKNRHSTIKMQTEVHRTSAVFTWSDRTVRVMSFMWCITKGA